MRKRTVREKKPTFYAHQRIISGIAKCDYCLLPQKEWFPELGLNIEKSGKIRCGICTHKMFGLELPEYVAKVLEERNVFIGSPIQRGGLF